LKYENAVVLPLALSTAGLGLFSKSGLALPYPQPGTAANCGKAIIFYGASTAVGSSGIQLAVAAGVTVIATAGKHNLDYVKGLGATECFDHSSDTLEQDLLDAVGKSGKTFAGVYDAVAKEPTFKLLSSVTAKLGGGMMATVLEAPKDMPTGVKTYWRKFI
jgi:NADPH:quinone reductase-like Zn-dependent oxidoreductase